VVAKLCVMKQLSDCSTPVLRSSASKQWIISLVTTG